MPLADLTAVSNLALSHLGEPFLTDIDTDTGTTAEAVRLHLPQCIDTCLEGHVWSFATRCATLAAATIDEDNPPAPSYGSVFDLPGDSLRLIKVNGLDLDAPRQDFEIKGRFLMLVETDADAPVVDYITANAPVPDWPTTFTDAVAFLLAARLAPLLTQSQPLAAQFLQAHEIALGKARSKDARETRSNENHGPRALAARSGLVNARFSTSALPPYA